MLRFEDIPKNIVHAGWNTWRYQEPEGPLSAFAERWGGLEEKNVLRAFLEGEGDDTLFAIFALPSFPNVDGLARIAPLLNSAVREERWASAIALGELHDERVFLRLQDMLFEGLDAPTLLSSSGPGWFWYDIQRFFIVSLLSRWGNPQIIPFLREALRRFWELENKPGPFEGAWQSMVDDWHELQDRIAYALGEWGAWGILIGLGLSESHQRMAIRHMVLGHFHLPLLKVCSVTGYYSLDDDPKAIGVGDIPVIPKKQFQQVLVEKFGFSEQEQALFFRSFDEDIDERMEACYDRCC